MKHYRYITVLFRNAIRNFLMKFRFEFEVLLPLVTKVYKRVRKRVKTRFFFAKKYSLAGLVGIDRRLEQLNLLVTRHFSVKKMDKNRFIVFKKNLMHNSTAINQLETTTNEKN